MIIARNDAILDQSERVHLYNHLSNYTNIHYYMAGSASGKDEGNPVFSLASGAGKMGLFCLLGIARFVPAKAKFFV